MRFSVEAWAPEYGTSSDDDPFESIERSDLGVEQPPAAWAPVRPPDGSPAPTVLFVDGVMRVDARIWVHDEAGVDHPGLCCSYGVGAVRCGERAEVVRADVERGLFTAAPDAEPIATRLSGTFEARSTRNDSVDSNLVVVRRMRAREHEIAGELVDQADLLIADGPLHDSGSSPHTVGYVKTHRADYLTPEAKEVVTLLEPGERTPLFLVVTPQRSRYSWYVRLPGRRVHTWAGIVRCEASSELETGDARVLADGVTVTLPRYASSPHKDPRAPQNLYPIAGLERELRRRLGDPQIVWRDLQQVSATTGVGSS